MLHQQKEILKLDLPVAVSAEISIMKDKQVFDDLENDHRFELNDDRAKLIFLLEDALTVMLDFEEVVLTGPALLFISPEQACKVIDHKPGCVVYGLSYSAALVIAELEKLTNDTFADNLILKNSPQLLHQVKLAFELMCTIGNGNANIYARQSLHGLLLTLMSLIAGASLSHPEQAVESINPLSIDFRRLLKEKFKQWKKPADYARALGTTVGHLNDCVKIASGLSVTEQIQHRIVLETKRLLFFSELTMKEIGYELGFEDPVYFNRLFKKLTGLTPLSFRTSFRDQYHKYLHPFYQCTRKAAS